MISGIFWWMSVGASRGRRPELMFRRLVHYLGFALCGLHVCACLSNPLADTRLTLLACGLNADCTDDVDKWNVAFHLMLACCWLCVHVSVSLDHVCLILLCVLLNADCACHVIKWNSTFQCLNIDRVMNIARVIMWPAFILILFE